MALRRQKRHLLPVEQHQIQRTHPARDGAIREITRHVAMSDTLRAWARILIGSMPEAILETRDSGRIRRLVEITYSLLKKRPSGRRLIRVSDRIIMILQDDRPFLLRTLREFCRRQDIQIELALHPVISVTRSASGALQRIAADSRPDAPRESFIILETGGQALPATFASRIEDVMKDLERAIADFIPMRDRWLRMMSVVSSWRSNLAESECSEAADFIRWLADGRFVFLGAIESAIRGSARRRTCREIRGSRLGILTGPSAELLRREETAAIPGDDPLLHLSKSQAGMSLYMEGSLDMISFRELDKRGNIARECLFYGHYSDRTDFESKVDAPILRRKYARIREMLRIAKGSFDDRELLGLFSGYRVDSLLLTQTSDLAREFELSLRSVAARSITGQRGSSGDVQIAVRYDPAGSGISILLVMPQDRYRPSMRDRVEEIALPLTGASSLESRVIADSAEGGLVRLQFHIPTNRADIVDSLAPLILSAVRTWDQRFEAALRARYGARAESLLQVYAAAFDESYKVIVDPDLAADDIADLENPDDGPVMRWGRPSRFSGISYLKIFSPGRKLAVSDIAPILVDHDFIIDEENSFFVSIPSRPVHLHIFRLRARALRDKSPRDKSPRELTLVDDERGRAVAESILASFTGRIDHDSLCGLIVSAGMSTAEIDLLRMMRNYARQTGAIPAKKSVNRTLLSHPDAARLLIALFAAKFDPDRASPRAWNKCSADFQNSLSKISSLDDDRALRAFSNIIDAAVRTNFFMRPVSPDRAIALKIDCAKISRMPAPRPWREIIVYGGARMEGCHLRGGPVARGGIRWSERPEDFRTEILGLMKTQITKNAQIVPTGAKGGFIVKREPVDRAALGEEVRACYQMLIRAMLDMQDNIDRSTGRIVRPDRVIAHDGDDPYLVVAADKGTAKFSDTANALSLEYGFWLGDAFASGGSNGYDHKVEGITARGAWISVMRHFRDMGRNIERESFTAIGIGDMSGDVFGNGLLLSRTIMLIGAFDHRDILLDPDPDPDKSWKERRRLFALPRSSWADFNSRIISRGGGVFSRSSKSIPLSPEIRARLGIDAVSLDPDSLIRVLLTARVDLLYNGGIGTYVKASHEPNSEVGDPQNDQIRVDASKLRCSVVGEGGNLGFTQSARIEFALAGLARGGGRIYTDAMDNSAGVDLSDHEVNLKILLDGRARRKVGHAQGEADRTRHLMAFKESIIRDVLADNLHQTLAVSLDELRSRRRLAPFAAAISSLQRRGVLDPALENLPDEDVIRERTAASTGLVKPELCVLLSYAKIDLTSRLLDSPLISRSSMDRYTVRYFSEDVRRKFERTIPAHRLRDHILATVLTNAIVNFHGATAIHRLTSELGLAASRVVESLLIAREILGIDPLFDRLSALDGNLSSALCYDELLVADEAVVLAARWLVRNVKDLRGRMEKGLPEFARLPERFLPLLPAMLPDDERKSFEGMIQNRILAGMKRDFAERMSLLEFIPSLLDIVQLARAQDRPISATGRMLYAIGDRLRLEYLIRRLKSMPLRSDWDGSAATDVIAELRQSRRRIASRIMDLGVTFDEYTGQRYRSWETLQSAIARIESEEPHSIAPFIVISGQIRNLAAL